MASMKCGLPIKILADCDAHCFAGFGSLPMCCDLPLLALYPYLWC